MPLPIENSSTLNSIDKQKVIEFINSCTVIANYKGSSYCRICNKRNGSADLGFDNYIFPSGLSHYIKDHNVEIDKDFIEKILKRVNSH